MPDLEVTLDYKLEVGSSDENIISVKITATKTDEFFLSIDIPCGEATSGRAFLCGDAQSAQLHFLSDPADKVNGSITRESGTIAWRSEAFALAAGERVAIRVTGFNPQHDGNANLHLKLWSDPDKPMLYDKAVSVPVSAPQGVAIIDFDISEMAVIQGKKITISCLAAGAETVALYDNILEISVLSSVATEVGTRYRFDHTPQKDTNYCLKARGPGQVVERYKLVLVERRKNWSPRDLLVNSLSGAKAGRSYYPTLVLAAKDLSGNTPDERLYGVFVNKETKEAELWSSKSGLDGWRWESDVPEGMGESPGVIHNQALWLIGGSSAAPVGPDSKETASNRVFWYYKDANNKMAWREWDPEGSERKAMAASGNGFAPRKCHACASFHGKVWVLGGLSDDDITLDEVWTCSADPVKNQFTPWTPSKPLPSPRCMAAVTTTPKMGGVPKPRLWLYGGSTHPYNFEGVMDELMFTEDGTAWETFEPPSDKTGGPLAATLFYSDDGYLHLAGVFENKAGNVTPSLYTLQGADLQTPRWPGQPFPFDIRIELFRIGSVSFRNHWIFWPVYQTFSEKNHYEASVYTP